MRAANVLGISIVYPKWKGVSQLLPCESPREWRLSLNESNRPRSPAVLEEATARGRELQICGKRKRWGSVALRQRIKK